MVPAPAHARHESNLFMDMMEAASDRHGQMDIRLEHLSFRLPILRDTLEVNGTISVTIHMRDLTEKEKQARIERELKLIPR
jgi:hypothetical protein